MDDFDEVLVGEHLYFAVGHGDCDVVLGLAGEELADPEVEEAVLVVVAGEFLLLSDVLDELGVLGERVLEHDVALEQEVHSVRDPFLVRVDDLPAPVRHLLYLVDQLLVDLQEFRRVVGNLPKRRTFLKNCWR